MCEVWMDERCGLRPLECCQQILIQVRKDMPQGLCMGRWAGGLRDELEE